ncbi:hypothetical protein C8R43DRAFT_977882 [Mycena crocata]|nr:hypothetical protein C8R43DRAFT_977882 [Mycena crocata]
MDPIEYSPISQESSLDGPDDFPQSISFMPLEEAPSRPHRARHARKQPDGHIPRPPNAFILFRSSFIRNQRVSSEVETNHSTLSKIIGLTWQNLPADERRLWHAKARAAGEEHRRRFPAYSFRPLHRRTAVPDKDTVQRKFKSSKDPLAKRRAREHAVVDDPVRYEKIAALLVEGKHGRTLDAAVQAFDKERVPAGIVARFEPPMTATAYRRASSAPAPDTEPPVPFLHINTQVETASQRRRSSSTGPPSRSPGESESVEPGVADEAAVSMDEPAMLETPTALESPFFAWPVAAETDSFDFSGFSFTAEPAPSSPVFDSDFFKFDFTCGPLWNHTPSAASEFNSFSVTTDTGAFSDPNVNIGAFIAADWERAGGTDWQQPAQSQYYSGSPYVSTAYSTFSPAQLQGMGMDNATVQSQPYLSNNPPENDSDLSYLMAQYTLS